MMSLRNFCCSLIAGFVLAGFLSVSPQTPEQLNRLSAVVESGTVEEKRDALGQLRRFESESSSRLAARLLNDPSEIVRATAISAVIYLPRNDASSLITPSLSDRSKFVRREAAETLGVVGNPDSAVVLLAALKNDKDPEVRSRAAAALGPVGNIIALGPLTDILRAKPKSARAYLRRSAARSIGQIAQQSRDILISTATPESFLPDKLKTGYREPPKKEPSMMNFRDAALVLGRVLSNLKETNDTRREAAFSLGMMGDTSYKPLLTSFLNDPDYYLAEICREALITLSR